MESRKNGIYFYGCDWLSRRRRRRRQTSAPLIANFEMTSHQARRVVNGDTRSSGQVIRVGFVDNGRTFNARGALE